MSCGKLAHRNERRAPGTLSRSSICLMVLAQVMISGLWDQAPHPALCPAWSLLKDYLSLSLPAVLEFSLILKQPLKPIKTDRSIRPIRTDRSNELGGLQFKASTFFAGYRLKLGGSGRLRPRALPTKCSWEASAAPDLCLPQG